MFLFIYKSYLLISIYLYIWASWTITIKINPLQPWDEKLILLKSTRHSKKEWKLLLLLPNFMFSFYWQTFLFGYSSCKFNFCFLLKSTSRRAQTATTWIWQVGESCKFFLSTSGTWQTSPLIMFIIL